MRLLPLTPQLSEALVELLVHRAEREDVVRDLGDARVGKFGRLARRDRPSSGAELH